MNIHNQLIQKYLGYEIVRIKEQIFVYLELEDYIKKITFSNTSRFKNLWLKLSQHIFRNFIILKIVEEENQSTYYYLNNRIFSKVKPWIRPGVDIGTIYCCSISCTYHEALCNITNILY